MDKVNFSLPMTYTVKDEVCDDDNRFLYVEIDVLHTDVNENKSVFTKDVVDSCIDTIKNVPILGFIELSPDMEKDFSGHKYVLTRTDDGGLTRKYLGSAYGVIPESCNPRWVIKLCDDGVEREFMRVDGLMWTKFAESKDIMLRDREKPHSMELYPKIVDGYEDEDGIFHFEKFYFDGCCVLGDHVQPAMINSEVRLKEVQFTMTDFSKALQSELNDKFILFTKLVDEKINQGGTATMPKTDYTQTVLSQFDDISAEVSQFETVRTRWGEDVPRYYVADIQGDEVIAVDTGDHYRYYGFAFTMDGDKPVIDFNSRIRKKLCYENYEEGSDAPESAFDFGKHIDEMDRVAFEKVEAANGQIAEAQKNQEKAETDYTSVKERLDEIEPKYNEYVKADEARQAAELEAEKDSKFAEYESELANNTEFTALKERKNELSVDDIEKECSLLFWKASRVKTNFSKENSSTVVVGIMDNTESDSGIYRSSRYGDIVIG